MIGASFKGLVVAAAALVAALAPAFAHRMPEAEVTIENAEIDGALKSAFTIRLHAEDVLRLLGLEQSVTADLNDPELHEAAAAKVVRKVVMQGGELQFLGGMVEGNHVFLFLVTEEGAQVERSAILSSVYGQWTNRINDVRSGEVKTQLFTQGGELKGHRH